MKKTKIKKKGQFKGEINIIEDWCKGCSFCITFCPKQVLKESDEFNSKGYHPPVVEFPENCTLCKHCEMVCPEFAIWIEKEKVLIIKE